MWVGGEFVSLLFVSGFFDGQKKRAGTRPTLSSRRQRNFWDASYNMAILQAQDRRRPPAQP
jgi:hypothetical protein